MIYLVSVLAFLLLFFIIYCIKFALIIIKMQQSIEESLDLIDEKYQRITEISEIPVFFDSPEIRRLLGEIESTKFIILEIANRLSSSMSKKNTIEDKEEE